MKTLLTILVFILSVAAQAQTKQEREVLTNTILLEKTVFGTKDSLALEKLFAEKASYIHSSGKVESRAEAIRNIVINKSVYAKVDTLNGYSIKAVNDSMVVNHAFVALEKKADGSESMLRLNLELVWIQEEGKLKLFRRKATRIQ